MEPRQQRRGRLVENGSCRGGNLSPAIFTTIDLLCADAKMFGHLLTFLASDAVGPPGSFNEVQAGIIVRELCLEVLDGVSPHSYQPLYDSYSLAHPIRDVKG